MSLIDAWITPVEALVAVDSDASRIDGSRFGASKVMVIPHLNVAMALRGQLAFMQFLHLRAVSAGFDTFDELDDALPALLADTEASVPAELMRVGALGNELVVVGWSDRRSSMLGRQFVKRADDAAFRADDFDMHISPWDASMQDLPKIPHAVDQIARAQVHWMRATFPGAVCGGKLILCHVTRKGIAMSHKLNFEHAEVPA